MINGSKVTARIEQTSEQGQQRVMTTGEPERPDQNRLGPTVRFTKGGRGQRLCAASGLSYYVSPPADGASPDEIVILFHGKEHFGRIISHAGLSELRAVNPRALIIAPNAPLESRLSLEGTGERIAKRAAVRPTRSISREWYHVPPTRDVIHAPSNLRTSLNPVLDQVSAFITARLSEYGMDETKLTLLGFSQGGTIAGLAAGERPVACKGVYMFSSPFFNPTINLHRNAPLSRPPIFYGYVKGDDIVRGELHEMALHAMAASHLNVTVYTLPSYPVLHRELPKMPYTLQTRYSLKWPFIRRVRVRAEPVDTLYFHPSAVRHTLERGRFNVPHLVTDDQGNQVAVQRLKFSSELKTTAHFIPPQMIQAAYAHRNGVVTPDLGMTPIGHPMFNALAHPHKSLALLVIGHTMALALKYTNPATVFGQLVRNVDYGFRRLRHFKYHLTRKITQGAIVTAQQIMAFPELEMPDNFLDIPPGSVQAPHQPTETQYDAEPPFAPTRTTPPSAPKP